MADPQWLGRLFPLWEKTRRWHVWLWLAVHLAVGLGFALLPHPRVNTELGAILPDASADRGFAQAERAMASSANRGFYVLVSHPDFGAARAAALAFQEGLQAHGGIESLTVSVDGALLGSFQDYLFENRYRLLSPDTRALLAQGRADTLGYDALQTIANPLAVGALARIDQDPWLLSNRSLQSLLGSSLIGSMAVSLREGVLAAEYQGRWYVLVNGRTSALGVDEAGEGHVVPAMRGLAERLASERPGLDFTWSGVAFHSYDSSRNAQREIGLTSSLAMAATILLLLLTFTSLLPLAATLLNMGVGVGFGLAASFIVFGEIHIFTIVFGASVIGISLDYSLYYFSERLNPQGLNGGPAIIKRSLPGITLGLVTTLLSYAAFLVLRFPLLEQLAVFSAMGLVSSFLSVVLLYPYLPAPKRLRPGYAIKLAQALLGLRDRLLRLPRAALWTVAAILALVSLGGFLVLRFNHDVRALYKMSPELAASEGLAAKVLAHGSAGQYFLVRGADPEELLEREEALSARLEQGIAEGKLGSWLGTSLLLPSRARQTADLDLVQQALLPSLPAQLALLDFPPELAEELRAGVAAQAAGRLEPQDFLDKPVAKLLGNLWIGQIGDAWYSAVLVFKVQDPAWLRGLAEAGAEGGTGPGALRFSDKSRDISAMLRNLSDSALLMLVLAYLVILAGLVWLYGWKSALRLFAIPLAASVLTIALLSLAGMQLNLFVVMGLIMVPGIGSDYAIFFREGSEEEVVTMLAVFECMFGTVMSFGALGLSALAGSFGLTVAIGVAISFLLSPLAQEGPGALKPLKNQG